MLISGREGVARTVPSAGMRALLCHPDESPIRSGARAVCPQCGAYWDLDSCSHEAAYGTAYPSQHLHFENEIGRLKVKTMTRWLRAVNVDPRQHVVCEVGFGGGFCLASLHGMAQDVFGIEVVPESVRHAISLGLPASQLYLFRERPSRLPRPISLWLFQDSFEHVLDVEGFFLWVRDNSTRDALVLIVSPDAMSWSRRLLGRYWPHKLNEHLFHWSLEGLAGLCRRYGFSKVRRFSPMKRISTAMALNHLALMRLPLAGLVLRRVIPSCEAWFNVGEMGVLFQRDG